MLSKLQSVQQQSLVAVTFLLEQQGQQGQHLLEKCLATLLLKCLLLLRREKTVAGVASVVSQPLDVEPTTSQAEKEPDILPKETEQDPTFKLPDVDDSPQITIPHDGDLKHSDTQCFCGKSDLKTKQEHEDHFKKCHQHKGKGVNPKIALCGLRWFKLNVSKCQKDVKLSKRCQMSNSQTPGL